MTKSKLVKIIATSQEDGLHIIIPRSVQFDTDDHSQGETTVYALSANGVIQLTSRKVDSAIPPLSLEVGEFITNNA